jgi:FKBP-type peptidyl-prolyl cis-trans isomerase SlyD
MQISNNTAVTIHYTLTNDAGEKLDSTEGGDPMVYLHGSGSLIPGLEKALINKSSGDKVSIRLEAVDAYGEFTQDMIQVVSKEMFDGVGQLEVGMKFRTGATSGSGIVTILGIDGDDVTIDGNHPLAGEALNFDVEIVNVRLATKDEISHGHVHGAGCHH